MARLLAPVVALLMVALPAALEGQLTLAEGDDYALTLGGYLRSLTGLHDAGYDLPVGDRRSAFNSAVTRLRWRFRWGDRVTADVHSRLQARISTAEEGFGESVAGFGVGAVPGRSVDLESVWIDDARLRVWHDLDRLSLTFRTGPGDLTVGRQPVSWGEAFLFPVADLWAQFSPFELDTEEKPGTDGVRFLAYPRPGLELDFVAADRGTREDFSVGGRATFGLPAADLYVAGGKLWNQVMAMAGITWLLETVRLRAEAVVPWNLDADDLDDPRLTLGVDRIAGRLSLTAEYHFNGLGARSPDGYLERLGEESFTRGESYFLGRHYLGGLATWSVDRADRVTLGGSVLVNVQDPSTAVSPILTWELGPTTNLSLGGLLTLGAAPAFPAGPPELGSEYGTYGHLAFTRFSLFF